MNDSMVGGSAGPVDAIRAFNRFYTRRIGLLDEALLDSGFTLTEVRVLYEVAHRDGIAAGDLARELALDAGYVSRLVKRLHGRGLIGRTASALDGRRTALALTTKGRRTFRAVEAATHDQMKTMIEGVAPDAATRLVGALGAIREVLGDPKATAATAATSYVIRDPRPGDLGWVVHRQAVLYAHEYGWDMTFEGLVAEIVGRFVRTFDASAEHCWIAERDHEIVGSIFVVRKSPRVAQLRLLYVEPSARGLGIGACLVDECIAFAKAKGYRSITLWTNSVLDAARTIYRKAGFELVGEEAHRSFGKDLVGQNWTLRLR